MLPTDYACQHGAMVNAIQNAIMAIDIDLSGKITLDFQEAEKFIFNLKKGGYELRKLRSVKRGVKKDGGQKSGQ